MGRKNKQKVAKRQSKTQRSQPASPPPFVPSKEIIATLENLSVDTTGTAEDHGLVGDCPYCLESLPPFWKAEDHSFKKNTCHIFGCCGKCCCMHCRKTILDKISRNAYQNLIQQHPNHDELYQEELAAGNEFFELGAFANQEDFQLWRVCPFCRCLVYDERDIDKMKGRIAEKAENGYSWAQFMVAMDQVKATEQAMSGIMLLHSSAIKGYPLAIHALAGVYYKGLHGVKKSTKMGDKLLDLALQQGDGFAGTQLSVKFRHSGDYAKSLEYGKQASDLGCSISSNWLAGVYNGVYEEDYGVQDDPYIAFGYMKRAADQGDANSQYFTALEYMDALGDEEKGVYYLQMAADQDYAKAEYRLGLRFLRNGKGELMRNGEDWVRGVQWLRRARKGGSEGAVEDLKRIESVIASRCFNCGAKADEKKFDTCSKCKTVAYCSKDCQIAAWKGGHKDACVEDDACIKYGANILYDGCDACVQFNYG